MNNYVKVIDVLTTSQNWEALVIEIAKKHPKAVLDAVKEHYLKHSDRQPWVSECIALMKQKEPQKIAAIKLCRAKSGRSLIEAKEFVENL